MKITVALAHITDSREDFRGIRKHLVDEEVSSMAWLKSEYQLIESPVMHHDDQVGKFILEVKSKLADVMVIHIPVWADPVFSLKLARQTGLPTILVGNLRPETSSMVGLLGAGGSLDQVGITHFRVFNQHAEEGCRKIKAFIQAAGTISRLRGQTLGLFGGPSLGIFTAGVDPILWQKLFGLHLEYVDQLEIPRQAELIPDIDAEKVLNWLTAEVKSVSFNQLFTREKLDKQVRSYLSTLKIARDNHFDFVGVKCQPELSDGYVSQCVAHMLMNSNLSPDGKKDVIVHACESDADAALTMQIMHLLSGGLPTALLDLRLFDPENGTLVLTNCGAIPPCFCITDLDPTGLKSVSIESHIFGKEGGGALPAIATPRQVTLARLCRLDGEYWMAIVPGEIVTPKNGELDSITPAFPKAFVRTKLGEGFLEEYSSNHIHMVEGNIATELSMFCDLLDLPWKIFE